MRIQIVANMTIVFKYLKSIETIKLGNIGRFTTFCVVGNMLFSSSPHTRAMF